MKIKKAKKKEIKKGFFLILTGLLLIAAALCLTIYNIWDEKKASESANQAAEQLKVEILDQQEDEQTEDVQNEDVVTPTPETEVPNPEDLVVEQPAYVLNPEMEMPEKEYKGRKYVGILEIPSHDLELPIINDWSYPALKKAPCRYFGSVYKDNMVIAAHNYNSHFGCLKELKTGEMIRFTDMDGNVFEYRVIGQEILQPVDVEEMTNAEWDLTLFTCTLGGEYRVTVRCQRIN